MKNSRIIARINSENTACKCPSGKEFSWSNIKITKSHSTFLLESICFNDWCFPFVLVSGVHLRTRSKHLQYHVRRVQVLGDNAVLQFKFQTCEAGILPDGNRGWIVYDAECVRVTVGHKKPQSNINKEGNLANHVQEEEVPRQPPEEPKFQGCKEGTKRCPKHYEPCPYPIPPAETPPKTKPRTTELAAFPSIYTA